jgi:hypothetical protein
VQWVAVHVSTSSFEKSIALGGAGEVVRKDGKLAMEGTAEEIGSTRVAEEASSESIEHDPNMDGPGWEKGRGTSATSGIIVLQRKTRHRDWR